MTALVDSASPTSRLAAFLDVDPDVVDVALANLAADRCTFLVVSGKLASGKDTVAPAILDRLGYTETTHLYYALPLKEELNAIMGDIRAWFFTVRPASMTQRRRRDLAHILAAKHDMSVEHAEFFVGRLLDQVRMTHSLHSRSRTEVVRQALQRLGTDVRRSQDPEYWVKLALKPAVETLAQGRSVFFTDARFPNEVEHASLLGARTCRLDISRAVQADRLRGRDGIAVPSEETLTHLSETSLDDYAGFDIRVSNDGTLEEGLAAVLSAWSGPRALAA